MSGAYQTTLGRAAAQGGLRAWALATMPAFPTDTDTLSGLRTEHAEAAPIFNAESDFLQFGPCGLLVCTVQFVQPAGSSVPQTIAAVAILAVDQPTIGLLEIIQLSPPVTTSESVQGVSIPLTLAFNS